MRLKAKGWRVTVSIWQANDTQPMREVDFLVVGAGVVGCSAAYFAAQAGRQVVITEAGDLALGASSRNAGMLVTGTEPSHHYSDAQNRELWALSERTTAYMRQFAQTAGVPMEQRGSLALAETPEEKTALQAQAHYMESLGIACEYLDHDPLGRGFYGAVRKAGDAVVQPYQLVQAIHAASGADLIPNNPVYRIEQTTAELVTVWTRQYRFQARYVLLCTNAFSVHIDPYFMGRVIPTRGQILVTAALPDTPLLDHQACYSDSSYWYFRDTFDGRLLIGGGRKTNKLLEHDTTDDRITEPVQRALEGFLHKHFPEISAPIERRWAGIMGFSVDGIPLVGYLPGRPRVGFAVAFTGHGMAMGAGTAERAVDHLLTGAAPGCVDARRLN
jgi:glycine/D-amino acid oxidase-like deaminating enzyme